MLVRHAPAATQGRVVMEPYPTLTYPALACRKGGGSGRALDGSRCLCDAALLGALCCNGGHPLIFAGGTQLNNYLIPMLLVLARHAS